MAVKRQRPQWQFACTMLTIVVILGIAGYTLGEGMNEGDLFTRRKLQTVPPVLQPIPPPNEDNVTSVPTIAPSEGPDCPTEVGGGSGCTPTAVPGQGTFLPSVPPIAFPSVEDFETTRPTVTPGPFVIQTPEPSFAPVIPDTPPPMDPPIRPPMDPPTDAPVEPQTRPPVEPPPPRTPPPVVPEVTPEPSPSPFESPIAVPPPPVDPPSEPPVVETPTLPPVVPDETPDPSPPPFEVESPIEVPLPPVDPPSEPPVVERPTPPPVVPDVTPDPSPPPFEAESPIEVPLPPVAPPSEPPVVETLSPVPSPRPDGAAPMSQPTKFELTDPPTSSVVEVPIEPFILTLGFDEQQTGTAEDLEVLTSEVERILSEHLFEALTLANTNSDVTLEIVDLTVTPNLRRRRATDKMFDGRRGLRRLQTETVDFTVSGIAVYRAAGGAQVDRDELTYKTNDVVAKTVTDPAVQESLKEEFRANEQSDALSNTTGVTAQAQDSGNDGSSKPTTVATVFGFLLVGLGVIGLCLYGWAFYKKRRKRARQRKRERQRGLGDSFNNPANTMASMVSMNSSINRRRSSTDSKLLVLPPTEFEESSESVSASSSSSSPVSDASSAPVNDVAPMMSVVNTAAPPAEDSDSSASDPYEGVPSDTSSTSDFTRELELAASLDRRSYMDTQRERSAMEEDGGAIQYPEQYGVQAVQPQERSASPGAVAGAVAGGVAAGVAVAAVASYPYGDEEDSDDEERNLDDIGVEGDEGIEWTDEGVWNPYDGYTKQEAEAAEKSRGSVSSISESQKTDSRSSRGAWMKSFSRSRRAPEDHSIDSDSAREAVTRDSLLGSMDNETDSEEEEIFVQTAERAVEVETIESSTGTSNAVRMSPTASATELVVVEKVVIEETKGNDDDDMDSVLTEDIVKEVNRLARFVKKYDKKRERKLKREQEREEKAKLAIKDSQSIPSESVGYDAMSDSVSALRKGKVDTSPRRERTALANPVEETDESSSERSWSTTSNANRAFDDDEVSSQDVDDSEIDELDDSIGDDGTSLSVTDSDISRLGITPISVQKVVGMPRTANPARRSSIEGNSAPETSRPPVSGKQSRNKGLPPLPSTPGSPNEEDSPEKTHTPVQTIKKAMRRVSSARQQKFSPKNRQEQARTTKESRGVGLTVDTLQGLSDGNGPAGVSSPPYQKKGALSDLRKNEAILDTASSYFTDGVTSSQYEEAFKAGMIAQQQKRKTYLERRSFKQMMQRVPQDPPASTAESASLHATDEKRSPPGWESPQEVAEEARVPPALPKAQQKSMPMPPPPSEERVPWSQTRAPPQASPETETQPTEAKAKPFKAPSFRPGVQPATTPIKLNIPAASENHSGSKRSAPEAAPLTPRAQETAPAPVSPAARSPPRRKKRGSAFDNVVNMFEQKPHNAIYPAGANWQFNGATR